MIPQETVNLILETARIEEVVGDFVTLKRRGSSFVACCPFHDEKTPSFHVTPSKGIYKCFGCGKAGSAVGFVMEYEHLTYPEALRYLAGKYHIEVHESEETAEQLASRQHNESLLAASAFAHRFFQEQLHDTDEGRTVGLAYFHSRGLLDETIAKYGLGWAPKPKQTFTQAALQAGYKADYLTETGLCAQWEDGSLHDRFYDRVIFPIHSVSGRVIAFGGRTLLREKSDKIAKYVNSKESEIYVKSRSLYGISFAKTEIAKQDCCYLLEGYLDVLSMHQIGITNAVASSGTSLTEEQIRLIKRFTSNITVMYDGDSAGLHAAVRAIGMILKEGMNARVVFLPDGDDPDSFARKHTLDEIRAFIAAHAQDGISFKTDLLLREAGDDPIRRASLINEIADTIAVIPDPVQRQVYVDTVARRFGIDRPDILFDRIRRTREQAAAQALPRSSRSEALPPVSSGGTEGPLVTVTPVQRHPLETDALLAPSERELLQFLLSDGHAPMAFEADSPFYDPEGVQTVAEFIDAAIQADAIAFSNPAYRRTYDAYFALYDAGKSQEETVRELLDGPDREVAQVAGELATDKYELTVANFRNALTTRASWLIAKVPRSILAYQLKRLDAKQNALLRELAGTSDPAGQNEILSQVGRINAVKLKLNQKLGRSKHE